MKKTSLIIKNGHIVDPANKIDGIFDILVEGNRIAKVSKNINIEQAEIIDASKRIVMPGIVDMHTHLREPGREDKETILSGTNAALKGGVTTVLAMPNTTPAIDCAENAELLKDVIRKSAKVNVFIAGAITKNRLGEQLTDIEKMKKAGIIAISDDGASVDNEELLSEALKKAKEQGVITICHCEDKPLSAGGVVNLGYISTIMGLKGIPKESEFKRVQRDIDIAKKIDAPIHIAHISCRESVEIIAKAKRQGVKVTAETAPHYFSLTEEALKDYDTNMKMNPPLRTNDDIAAIKQGLRDGVIDAIASDHAPHTESDKDIEFEYAEFGVIGLETELAVSITELIYPHTKDFGVGVYPKILGWKELVELFTMNPAKILGIDKGTLGAGKDADIIIVDPQREWVVTKDSIVSKSKNSAFIGRRLKGFVEYTILSGKIVYKA